MLLETCSTAGGWGAAATYSARLSRLGRLCARRFLVAREPNLMRYEVEELTSVLCYVDGRSY